MDTIKDKVEALVTAIHESTEYRSFQEAEAQVQSVPGLADKIKEFCWKNYEIQNSGAEDLYERMEDFEDQYREFRKNPVVSQYLERELRLCRMLQEINARITDSIELMI